MLKYLIIKKLAMNMMRFFIYLIISLFLLACNTKEEDPAQEDYRKLFPFKGIEKPTINYEDLVHKQCDIDHYTYPGVETTQQGHQYTLTLTYQCKKGKDNVRDPRYYVCYVNAQKELVTLRATTTEQTVRFSLPSGYPLYLSVYGGGERESRVSAQLSAVDTQGIVSIPTLQYNAAQNTDGTDNVTPYCEYIVLP
ncbi:hypothetical protein HMPREF9071_1922 [Capnocytophaga sp. oral taxon 338 str. F0234]|nr:hypothetical protein HMPREF9071_1922 [Capnocytophaga sp. oral taxon 338 str. F0234]